MDKRIVAIQFDDAKAKDNVLKLVNDFHTYDVACNFILFRSNGIENLNLDGLNEVELPADKDNSSKIKNYIFDFVKEKNFKGFLHIVEDVVALHKDPSNFIDKVENAMDKLDYSIYFSTVTDPCNYIFKKFNPRMTIGIDDESIKSKLNLPDKISFTSHSNTCWTIYDFNKFNGCPLRFDERFSIAMYQIIEYLARRRATRHNGQLYYMNQYLSIVDEIGVYSATDINGNKIDQKIMQEEDAIFKGMKVDYAPDNNIDIVLDTLYQKLKQKMA